MWITQALGIDSNSNPDKIKTQEGHSMLRQNNNLFLVVFLVTINCFSAVKSEDDKLMEELSGQKKSIPMAIKAAKPAASTISEKHLFAGLDAFKVKNYILALKHYNTVILKHSKSKEVKSAYLAKSKLYSEMGLQDQSAQNLQMAIKLGNKITR